MLYSSVDARDHPGRLRVGYRVKAVSAPGDGHPVAALRREIKQQGERSKITVAKDAAFIHTAPSGILPRNGRKRVAITLLRESRETAMREGIYCKTCQLFSFLSVAQQFVHFFSGFTQATVKKGGKSAFSYPHEIYDGIESRHGQTITDRIPRCVHHVMNRGQSRRNIFIEDKGRQTFLDLLAERGTDGSDLSWQAIGRSQA